VSVPGNIKTSSAIRARIDSGFARVCSAQRETLAAIAAGDKEAIWEADGAKDMAQWVAGRLGISYWAASRWVNAAKALENLPRTSEAFTTGDLSIDKAVELTRYATPDTEKDLVTWAKSVNPATIRSRADVANRPEITDHRDAYNARHLYWWQDDLMLRFEGALPADAGAKLIKAIDRIADTLPKAPAGSEAEVDCSIDARRADALVALASARIADDQDADRTTVVVHVDYESLRDGSLGAEIESGGTLHPELVRALGCDGNIEWVLGDGDRHAVGIGKRSRKIPKWMDRQLRYRDGGCTFPGCGTRRFTSGHHIEPWPGPTNLNNLTLLCRFHHDLVHVFRWKVVLNDRGRIEWFRPDGRRFEAGLRREERAPP
jgi:hypothetical protein